MASAAAQEPPAEATEPQPVEATEPQPVEATEPQPVEATEPQPPEVAEPPLADSEEMIVTSQRYAQGLQDAPVAVTAFSGLTMDRRGVTNLQDVGKFTPNLELHSTNRPAGGSSAYAAYIRGIGTGDFQFPTDPGVGLYVDDVYMARTMGGLLSIDADIERVEVIKGPQGTLFGRNTIGGAFNVVTTLPETSGDVFGSALLRLGSYGRKDFTAMVNGPLIDDTLGAKLTIAGIHSDGFGKRVITGEKTNDEERLVVRGGLRLTPAEGLDIRLYGDYSRQDQNPPNGRLIRMSPMPPPPTVDKIARYNMIAAPALNPGLGLRPGDVFDARWVSPGPYDNYGLQEIHDRYDLGGGSLTIIYEAADYFAIKSVSAGRALGSDIAVDGDQTPYPLQSSATKLDQQQYSEELQLYGELWERLRYIVGLYVFRETGHSTVNTQSFHGLFENEPMPMPMDAGDTLTRFDLTATSYAAFTQETLTIVDGLHLTAGARFNRDEKDYGYGVDRPQTAMAQVPFSRANAAWNSFTPKVGADWSPIDELMIYASYAQGFKSGGFGPSNVAAVPTPKYDPETVTAYEVGVKTEWWQRRLSVALAGFFNDYQDIQLTVQKVDPMTNANVRTTQNAGNSKIKGFEAELVAAPFEGFNLQAGVGYVDAKFDSLTMEALMSGFKVGDRLPQVPDLSVNGGAQYAFDTGIGTFSLRGDVTYKGDQFLTAADPTSFQAGYVLVGARVGYIPDGLDELELSVQGINLGDQVYYVYRANLAPTGQEVAVAAQPRLIYATAKYLF